MAHFDPAKAYAKQEDVYFDDGREIELLHFVYGRSDIESIRGSPQRVLDAIDEYGRHKKYLMNVGEDKGRIVTDLIAEVKPKVMVSTSNSHCPAICDQLVAVRTAFTRPDTSSQVELGGYVGYSCILFGDALRKAGGERFYSLERSPEFAAVIGSLVELAGLSDVVKVVVGPSDVSVRRLHANGILETVDLLFLDHIKPAYLPDLKLCEQLRLVRPGTVIAADNVIKPGNPPYLDYVRSSVADKKAAATRVQVREGALDSRLSEKREGAEQVDVTVVGNPKLRYESRLHNSFEPTGIPVSTSFPLCHVFGDQF